MRDWVRALVRATVAMAVLFAAMLALDLLGYNSMPTAAAQQPADCFTVPSSTLQCSIVGSLDCVAGVPTFTTDLTSDAPVGTGVLFDYNQTLTLTQPVTAGASYTALVGNVDDSSIPPTLSPNGVIWSNAGAVRHELALVNPDCSASIWVSCVDGQATLALSFSADPPASFTGFDINSGSISGTFPAGSYALDNATSGSVAVVASSAGVYIAGDPPGASVDFAGIDCEVGIWVECVNGRAVLMLDPGATTIDSATVSTGPNSPVFWSDPWDPIEVSSSVSVELTEPYFDVENLRLVNPVAPSQISYISDFYHAQLTVPDCVVNVFIDCSSGAAVVFTQLGNGPATNVTVSPLTNVVGSGQFVVPNATAVTVTAGDAGVWVRNVRSESLPAPSTIVSADCIVDVAVICSNGQPILHANAGAAPIPYVIVDGVVHNLDSTGVADITVNTSPVVVELPIPPRSDPTAGSDIAINDPAATPAGYTYIADFYQASFDVPDCVVTGSAVARCANGAIEIDVTIDDAPAAAVDINGTIYPLPAGPSPLVATVDGLAPRDSYTISFVPAQPTAHLADTEFVITIGTPCTIDIIVAAQCVDRVQVQITATQSGSSTGTVDQLSVNGDSDLPVIVAPGTTLTVDVTSPDTLPADIAISEATVPPLCARSGVRPRSDTLRVDYDAVCPEPGATEVLVVVTTAGSADLLSLSVNGDSSPPYNAAAGAALVVDVETFGVQDVVEVNGPATAPECPAPTPTPTPTTPPAIIVSFDPEDDPTPEPTPQPTPRPTAQPTPEPTPEPTTTPEPVTDPTPEPTAEPSRDTVVADPAGIRQHGKSQVLLPAECDRAEIDLPDAVRLTRESVEDDGRIRFLADTTALDVGRHRHTITCAGTEVEIELFVYRQIGGQRGEANTVSRLAAATGLLALVLVGTPALAGRRVQEPR